MLKENFIEWVKQDLKQMVICKNRNVNISYWDEKFQIRKKQIVKKANYFFKNRVLISPHSLNDFLNPFMSFNKQTQEKGEIARQFGIDLNRMVDEYYLQHKPLAEIIKSAYNLVCAKSFLNLVGYLKSSNWEVLGTEKFIFNNYFCGILDIVGWDNRHNRPFFIELKSLKEDGFFKSEHFLQIGIYHTILQDTLFGFETDKLNELVTLIGLSRVDAKLSVENNYGSGFSESIKSLIQMISILESDY